MNSVPPFQDHPVERDRGISPRRERLWGWIGGVVGSAFGAGSALVAVYVEGSSWRPSGPYPDFFMTRRLLAYDGYLIAALAVGVCFLLASLVLTRFGRHPRTDGFGAGLVGTVLMAVAASILVTRLTAVIQGG